MFGTLLAKATALLGVVVMFLLGLLKYKDYKLDKQSDIIDAHDKKDEIIDDIRLAEVQAEVRENEAIKDTSDINWRDSI